jgi:hypothetical protein
MTMLTGNQIDAAQFLTIRSMLALEVKGMSRSRSPSAYMIARQAYGLKGTRQSVLEQMNAMRDKMFEGVPQ